MHITNCCKLSLESFNHCVRFYWLGFLKKMRSDFTVMLGKIYRSFNLWILSVTVTEWSQRSLAIRIIKKSENGIAKWEPIIFFAFSTILYHFIHYDVQFFEAAFDIADLKNQFEIMRARIDFPWRCVPLPWLVCIIHYYSAHSKEQSYRCGRPLQAC